MTVTEIISRHGKAACVLLRRSIDRMRFAEITLFGVSVAPVPLIMIGAWLAVIALRRFAGRFGPPRYVLHPALFVFAAYVLSSWILIFDRWILLP
jgi:protein AaeX